jgi:hypothetical protein
MKKKLTAKLTLSKETITDLDRATLRQVQGAVISLNLQCDTYPLTLCVQPNTV